MEEVLIKLMEAFKRLIEKLTSGRYVLTLLCGFVFAYCSITGKLSVEAITGVIMMVFSGYFNKRKE